MEKDFDRWNELKKQVNNGELLPLYHAREIWWAHLGVNVGYEQDGTGPSNERPVLIYEHAKTGDVFIVPDVQLRLDEIERVQTEVAALLKASEDTI